MIVGIRNSDKSGLNSSVPHDIDVDYLLYSGEGWAGLEKPKQLHSLIFYIGKNDRKAGLIGGCQPEHIHMVSSAWWSQIV